MKDIPTDADDCAIVLAIIAMAQQLKLEVIAEGVETEEQLHFLKENNCNEIQGYFFSRPVPATEFEKLLKKKTLRPKKETSRILAVQSK